MSPSLLGLGGFLALANTFSAAAPAILLDTQGLIATQDVGGSNIYSLTNLDTTNWLWVQIQDMHFSGVGQSNIAVPILPGTTSLFQQGLTDNNGIRLIRVWATVPNVVSTGSAPAGNLNCCGGSLAKH